MAGKSPEPALQDIIDAVGRIRSKLEGVAFVAFKDDWERRWIVERGVEIISEASRRLPDNLKARYPEIQWRQIAGIGNILRHDYDTVSPLVLWNAARNDFTALELACRQALAAEPAPDE